MILVFLVLWTLFVLLISVDNTMVISLSLIRTVVLLFSVDGTFCFLLTVHFAFY